MTNQQTHEQASMHLEEPRFLQHAELLIAGLRLTSVGDPGQEIPALWQRFAPHIGRITGQQGAVAYGLCLHAAAGVDYVAGCAVADFSGVPREWSCVTIPAQRYAIFAHRQHASTSQHTVQAIFTIWLPRSGYQALQGGVGSLSFLERYGEGFNPQTGLGDIEIWLPIKS